MTPRNHLLIWGATEPVVWLYLEGSLVLHMDDPDSAQNVHWRYWSYPKLSEADWAARCTDLRRRNGRLSLGYISGGVDDGNAERGVLTVDGREARRIAGRIHY